LKVSATGKLTIQAAESTDIILICTSEQLRGGKLAADRSITALFAGVEFGKWQWKPGWRSQK